MSRSVPSLIAAIAIMGSVQTGAAQKADRKFKLEFDELAAKAEAIIDTVNGMEQKARTMGQSMNPALVAGRARVRSAMDNAEAALKDNDTEALKESLKVARGVIERLSRML